MKTLSFILFSILAQSAQSQNFPLEVRIESDDYGNRQIYIYDTLDFASESNPCSILTVSVASDSSYHMKLSKPTRGFQTIDPEKDFFVKSFFTMTMANDSSVILTIDYEHNIHGEKSYILTGKLMKSPDFVQRFVPSGYCLIIDELLWTQFVFGEKEINITSKIKYKGKWFQSTTTVDTEQK